MPFQRDGPPPLVDGAGNLLWIVDRIVDHSDLKVSPRHGDRRRDAHREQLDTRLYRFRWLGFSAESESREPRKTILEDVPDVVKAYEAAATKIAADERSAMQGDLLTVIDYDDSISPSLA